MTHVLAIDQGTTGTTCLVVAADGRIAGRAYREITQHYPRPGWVEHDATEILDRTVAAAREAISAAGVTPRAIGITNQRETVVVWDRNTGAPVGRAIVWQDRRTAERCRELAPEAAEITARTGLVVDPYFSATKLEWMLRDSALRRRAMAGELLAGTIDTWLIWRLTGGAVHATDPTNASRTMLYDIGKGAWDDELLKLFDVPRSMLPEVRSSSEVYGHTTMLGAPIPIAGIAGDQQAALFGQACVKPGMVKNTYGTGCFMLMNTGTKRITSKHNLLTTVAWRIGDRTEYALEGSIFIAGAVVQWLRDGLEFFRSAPEVEALAASVSDTGGVYLVPAFAGLGAPHWDQHARGTIVGLTRGTTRAHVARASLEGIALQVMDVLKAMEGDSGIKLKELRVDGGASANDLLMQLQSDLLNVPVVRPKVAETTALGAAYLAGLAVGFWKSQSDIAKQWQTDKRFKPAMKRADRERIATGWSKALRQAML